MGVPSLLIAGTHSGVGKTTISTGIMAALSARGLQVQGFKVGPDYIDPSYHTGATGRISRNLDTWLLGDNLFQTFAKGAEGADIAIIEGVMGMYDGIKGQKETGSSADVAARLNVPVVLIVDVKSTAYSVAAMVHGFATFRQNIKVVGVILNRVGSAAHYEMVKEAVEELGIPVLGHLGREENLVLPERHLGLVPLGEKGCRGEYFADLCKVIEAGIDLGRLIAIAEEHSCDSNPLPPKINESKVSLGDKVINNKCLSEGKQAEINIAVAKDEAFSFYYQDALELLEELGAKIIYFSPLHDGGLPPDTHGVFIGGGFPESFLPELESNSGIRSSLREAYEKGLPIYAECGGQMYLCEEIVGFDQKGYKGIGLIPGTCYMTKRLQGMGYRQGFTEEDSILGPKGTAVRGHEFHYSKIEYQQNSPAFRLCTAAKQECGPEGFGKGNLLATYLHQNFAGNPDLAKEFLRACDSFSQGA